MCVCVCVCVCIYSFIGAKIDRSIDRSIDGYIHMYVRHDDGIICASLHACVCVRVHVCVCVCVCVFCVCVQNEDALSPHTIHAQSQDDDTPSRICGLMIWPPRTDL